MKTGRLALALAAVATLYPLTALPSSVVLNEFMAINTNSLQDEDGEYQDWIEIYNAGTGLVDLAGWHLTDNSNNLSKWEFPSTNVAPGGFVIVFASDKNRAESGSELHTNFKLDGAGEYLALVEPDGSTVATKYAPTYPVQAANVSFGLAPGTVTNLFVETNAACRILVPVNDDLGYDWIEQFFDDSTWSNGILGIGFDNVAPEFPPDYRPDIRTDVSNAMFGANGTAYIRIPFVLGDPSAINSLRLDLKFDDGFIAYVNGEEVASVNDRDINTWNTRASAVHDVTNNDFETFTIAGADEFLELGTNVLAIHGLNNQTNSSDFLILPRLFGIENATVQNGLLRYFTVPTPRAVNAAGAADLGPAIVEVVHAPVRPLETEDLNISARIVPGVAGLATAELHYVVMFTNEVTAPLQIVSGNVYAAAVPASAFGTGDMIRFYVTAVGTNGITSRWPVADDTIQWLGTVALDPSVTSSLRVLEWFVQNPAWHVRPGGGNYLNWTNGYVYFDGTFYDGARMRVRGNTASSWSKPHYKFEFSKGHYFSWDSNQEAVEEFNLQTTYSDKAYLRQMLAMETYRDAGAPYSETFPLHVRQNGQFHSFAIWLEQPGEKYLARQGLDREGAFYKMFNVMTSSSSGVEKKTRKNEPNTDLAVLVAGVATTQTALARQRFLFDNADLPAMINYIAASTIVHENDHLAKNYYAYRDTNGDREWRYMPWDKDLTFGRNYIQQLGGVLSDTIWANVEFWVQATRAPSNPMYGDSDHQKSDSTAGNDYNRFIDAMHDTPAVRQMYLRRLRTLMDELLQTNGTPPGLLHFETRISQIYSNIQPDVELDRAKWGNPYGSNQTFEAALTLLTNSYLSVRRTHLYVTHSGPLGTNGVGIPLAQTNSPPIRFGQIEFSPANSNQAQEYIELVNTNAVAVEISGWSLSNAVKFTFEPGTVIAARSNLFVSPNSPAFRARPVSPKSNESRFVVGPYKNSLSARGETIELSDRAGALVNSLTYTGNPSVFLGSLRISEVMYHPDGDGDCEYIELKNIGTNALNLAGVKFQGGVSFAFTNFNLAPSGLTVLVRSLADFTNCYDPAGISIAGVYTGALDNEGEEITFLDPANEEILEFGFDDDWYPATDGSGYSLTIVNPLASFATWGESNAWRPSLIFRGTPGREEPSLAPGSIVINEALVHSDTNQDWLELRNLSTNDINVGGWLLSDNPAQLARFVIPIGTVVSAGAYRVFTENDFNNPTNPPCLVPFAFNELGDEIHLCSATNGVPTSYHDSLEFDEAERFITLGRLVTSDGLIHFAPLQYPTQGSNNAPPLVGPVVVSEIMYHPLSNGYEFIELRNLSNGVLQLFDPLRPTNRWKLTSGVDFTFPTNRTIAANSYALVVPVDPSQFRSAYGVPSSVNIFGPYTGLLNNVGERVRLRKPTEPETNGFIPYVTVDQVDFLDHAPWPTNADGTGASIEKSTNNAFGNEPAAWRTVNIIGSPGTTPQVDDNNDGLPDNWQLHVFNTTNAAGTGDWDFDGVPNQAEYFYGSAPTNASSMSRLTISNNEGNVFVKFPTWEASGPGYYGLERRYAVESALYATDTWSSGSSIEATNGTSTFIGVGSEDMRFYRVKAWLQSQ